MELGFDEPDDAILRRMGRDENGSWYYHDLSSKDTSLSTSVALAVSDVLERDVNAIEPPLSDVINPDALDRLFHTPPGSTVVGASSLDLHYGGLEVTVYSDGWICIAE